MRMLDSPRRRAARAAGIAGLVVTAACAAVVAAAIVAAPSGGSVASTPHFDRADLVAATRGAVTTPTSHATTTTSRTTITSHTTTTTAAPATTTAARPAATTTTAVPAATTSTTAPTTPTTPTTATASSNAACRGTTPLGLTGGWNCTFDDEFNGTSLNTGLWVPQLTARSGYVAGPDCYVNDPSTISVSGGYLNLSVRRVAPFTCAPGYTSDYVAGMVSTYGLFHQAYGAFEVNAKLPPSTVSGLQETFWLYPQTLTYGPWPNSGEIDFAEFFSQYAGFDVPYIHYAQSSGDPNVTAHTCTINQNTFNTYGVDWTPTSITLLDNGTTCLVDHPTTGSKPFDQPFFIALTQALGIGTNAAGPGAPVSTATTQVDWVRAWSPA